MTRMRLGTVVAAALVAGALAPIAAPAPACAAESPRAVLVVDTGSSVRRMCVALPEAQISGLDLIVAASNQHGLDYAFGYGGRAVCRLSGVGSASEECFEDDYPSYWAYWRGTASGGWTCSGSGAASTVVTDGDVEGWAWGEGTCPGTHASPPATAFGSVCPATRDDPSPPDRDDGGGSAGPDAPGGAAGAGSSATTPPEVADAPDSTGTGAAAGNDRKDTSSTKRPHSRRAHAPTARVASAEPTPAIGPPPHDPEDQARYGPESTAGRGPPVAGMAALAAAVVLAGLGAIVVRRRRVS